MILGSGKTQLLFQLAGNVALDKGSSVIYVDTEGSFHAHRLIQIAKARRESASIVESILCERVLIWKIDNLMELKTRIDKLTPNSIMGVKCIIIDSIACLYRSSSAGGWSRIGAANCIQGVIKKLKVLAVSAGLWVVVSNQMTTTKAVEEDRKEVEEDEGKQKDMYVATPAMVSL